MTFFFQGYTVGWRTNYIAWINGPNPLNRYLTGVVVGAESMKQFDELLGLFGQDPLSGDEISRLKSELPKVPERLLNPAEWPERGHN